MAILPKPSYRLNVIPMKIPVIFSTEINNNKKCKRPQIAKSAMKKKSNVGGITIPDFKLWYREKCNKKGLNKCVDQEQRIEDLDIPRKLLPSHSWQRIHNGEKTAFSTTVLRKLAIKVEESN